MSIFPQVLFPTEKISRLPLVEWSELLHFGLLKFNNYSDIYRGLDNFATILNQIPLVISFAGNINQAIKMCIDIITFYGLLYEKGKNEELLLQSIQAWINLGRIDRIQHNYQGAVEKFIFLQGVDSNFIFDEPFILPSKTIYMAINSIGKKHYEIKKVVDFCRVTEPAITLLKQKEYQTLLDSYPLLTTAPSIMSERLICEIQIVCLMSLRKYVQAKHYLQVLYGDGTKSHYHLFLFRNAELAFLTDDKLTLTICLGKLRQIVKKVDVDNSNRNAINFIFAYATLLFNVGQSEQAVNLIKLCYYRYCSLNDEVGQIQTLSQLITYSRVMDVSLHKKLQQLYQRTGYRFLLPADIKNEFTGYQAIYSIQAHLERKLKQLLF